MTALKKSLSIALSLVLLVLVLCGCGSNKDTPATGDTPTPESKTPAADNNDNGNSLNVGIAQDVDTLDPHMVVTAGARELLFNVYEGLLKPDSDGNLLPAVAEDYTISDTADSFTFTLREGVLFHNGNPVTAEDVVYSIQRAAESPNIKGMEIFTSAEVVDEKTIVINISEPNIEFLSALTAASIIPEGIDPATEVVGTGPFKFTERAPQEYIKIEKFADYYGTPAKLDSVTYKIIESGETLVMSLKSGALDLVAHLTAAQVAELGDDFNILEGTMNLVQALYLNNAVAPLDNAQVRQALCCAVNRQEVLDILADGKGVIVGSSMYPNFGKYFREDLASYYTYDPEKAKELLSDAGYPDGFEMDITVPSNYQPHIDTAEIIAEQLKAVGITVNIIPVDWDTWVQDTYVGRNFESTVVGVDASTLTARAMLERFTSDYDSNFINFNNSEYDEIFEEILACTDDAEQTQLYGRLQEILTEDAANVYIQDLCDFVAMGKNVAGYEFYPLYVMDMSTVYFTD